MKNLTYNQIITRLRAIKGVSLDEKGEVLTFVEFDGKFIGILSQFSFGLENNNKEYGKILCKISKIKVAQRIMQQNVARLRRQHKEVEKVDKNLYISLYDKKYGLILSINSDFVFESKKSFYSEF